MCGKNLQNILQLGRVRKSALLVPCAFLPLHIFRRFWHRSHRKGRPFCGNFQVYIAPTKALVQDKLRDWSLRFSFLGLKCQELTGDTNVSNVHELHDADVILTTPEVGTHYTPRHI